MEYPKAIMRITELVEMGYDRTTLNRWLDEPNFPKRRMGLGKKAPWGIDTKEFELWQKKKGLIRYE